MWILGLKGPKDLGQVGLVHFYLCLLQSGSETSCAKGIIEIKSGKIRTK